MKFAAIARNRKSERLIALVSAVGVFLSMMAIFAVPAQAHHPTTTANAVCDGPNVVIAYTSTSWQIGEPGHSDVRVEVSVNGGAFQEVASGAYNAGNGYTFSGTFPGDAYVGQSIRVRSQVVGLWSNGAATGNSNPAATTAPFTVNLDCAPDDVGVQVSSGVCDVVQGQPTGDISVSINPASGATVTVYSDSAMTQQVYSTSSGGSVSLPPGTYYWTATAANGYQLTGPSSGQVTIDDCEVSVSITAGVCVAGTQGAQGTAEVTIDPDTAATVEIFSDAAMNNLVTTVSASGTVSGLAPGTYYWDADPQAGFGFSGSDEGQFTIVPCEVTVDVGGVCVVDGDQGVGEVSVTISVPNGATVEIFDGNSVSVATLTESGTATVPEDASYTWTATPTAGYTITGATSGDIQVDGCTPPPPPPPPPGDEAEIIVEKIVLGGVGEEVEFTFDTTNFTLADNTLAHGESSSSGPLSPGDGYAVSEDVPGGWTLMGATCDDGSLPTNIDLSAGETVTCTFTNQILDEAMAAIQVTVAGSCELDGDEGDGVIEITMSVDDGAQVVLRDSDGDVVGFFDSDSTVTVAEGETYRWEATPNEGFEFPPGFASSGTITIETCSNPETLPFTGIDTDPLAMFGIVILLSGVLVVVGANGVKYWNVES